MQDSLLLRAAGLRGKGPLVMVAFSGSVVVYVVRVQNLMGFY